MTDEKMEPCPFCGQQPRISSSAFHAGYATCQAAGMPDERWHPAVTMTIEQWNRRTALSTKQDAEVEVSRSQTAAPFDQAQPIMVGNERCGRCGTVHSPGYDLCPKLGTLSFLDRIARAINDELPYSSVWDEADPARQDLCMRVASKVAALSQEGLVAGAEQEAAETGDVPVEDNPSVVPIRKKPGQTPVNLPFERIPQSADDPGFGPLPHPETTVPHGSVKHEQHAADAARDGSGSEQSERVATPNPVAGADGKGGKP
jgi:hypothetical protein